MTTNLEQWDKAINSLERNKMAFGDEEAARLKRMEEQRGPYQRTPLDEQRWNYTSTITATSLPIQEEFFVSVREHAKRADAQGMRLDHGKSRVDLLDPEWLVDVGRVLEFGANKYAANNWRGGLHYSRIVASALRHLFAYMRGEEFDRESGLRHLAHFSCNAMFLHWMATHRPDLDDRFKYDINGELE